MTYSVITCLLSLFQYTIVAKVDLSLFAKIELFQFSGLLDWIVSYLAISSNNSYGYRIPLCKRLNLIDVVGT